jgi:hypothetical protein
MVLESQLSSADARLRSQEPPRAAPAATAQRLDNALFIACGLACGAGLIHVEAAIQHVDEYVLYAVFFALLAPAQFAWGAAVYRRPGRRLLLAGAVGSLVVVGLWIVSRTSGLPIGPTPWQPEPVGAIDALATADEAVLALLAILQLRASRGGLLMRGSAHLAAATGTVLILFSSLALVLGGGHTH